jgi:hypothetical protein
MSFHPQFRSLAVAAAVVLAAPLLTAQEGVKPKQEGAKNPVAAQPAAATVQAPVNLQLSGLAKENVEKVQTALAGLSRKAWMCTECKSVHADKGKCDCGKELVSETVHQLGNIKLDPATGAASFMVTDGMDVKLSELERALAATPAKVDAEKMLLAGNLVLYVEGPPSAEAAKKLEDSMKTLKGLESLGMRHENESRDYQVTARASGKGVPRTDVVKTVQGAGEGFKLKDVAWTAAKRVS